MGNEVDSTSDIRRLLEMLAQGLISLDDFRRAKEAYQLMNNPDTIYQALCEKHKGFLGVPIGATDAAEKYQLRRATITDLVNAGYVRRITTSSGGRGPGAQMRLNLGDLLIYLDMRQIFNGEKPGPIKGWRGPFKAA